MGGRGREREGAGERGGGERRESEERERTWGAGDKSVTCLREFADGRVRRWEAVRWGLCR